MEAFREWLLRTCLQYYEGVDRVITRENVNDTYRCMGASLVTAMDLAVHSYGDEHVVKHLLSLGARIRVRHLFMCPQTAVLKTLLETGIDPNIMDPDEVFTFPKNCLSVNNFKLMAEYGAKWPPNYEWKEDEGLKPYIELLDHRIARCRRTLVALGAYCRRSPYHALCAWYRELAKEMWRMRGGGERCGPRGEGWEGTK